MLLGSFIRFSMLAITRASYSMFGSSESRLPKIFPIAVTFFQDVGIDQWSRLETQTDSELMKLVKEGDVGQLAHLFERHHLALFRYLFQLTRNRTLSEDLTQEVFLRALKYKSSYNPAFGFRTWLYGMARNACYDARHKVRGEIADTEMSELRSSEPAPEEKIAQQQHARLLQQALNSLPAEKREVLELSRFQEMRHEDIAALLKCEVGTVRVRIFRALNDLREKFMDLRGRQMA